MNDDELRYGAWLELVAQAVMAAPCSVDPDCHLHVEHHGWYADIQHGEATRLVSAHTLSTRPRAELVDQVARWLRQRHLLEEPVSALPGAGSGDLGPSSRGAPWGPGLGQQGGGDGLSRGAAAAG